MSVLSFPFLISPEDYSINKCHFLRKLINCITIEPSLKVSLLLISEKSENVLLSTIIQDLKTIEDGDINDDDLLLTYLISVLFNSLAKVSTPISEDTNTSSDKEQRSIKTSNNIVNHVFFKLNTIQKFKAHSIMLIRNFDLHENSNIQQHILKNLSLNFRLIALSSSTIILDKRSANGDLGFDIQFIESLTVLIATNINNDSFSSSPQSNKMVQNVRTKELFSICMADAFNIIANLAVESDYNDENGRNGEGMNLKWITNLYLQIFRFSIVQSYPLIDHILALSVKGKDSQDKPTIFNTLTQMNQMQSLKGLPPAYVTNINEEITQTVLTKYDIFNEFFVSTSIDNAMDSFIELKSIVPVYFSGLLYSLTNISSIINQNKLEIGPQLPKSMIFLAFIVCNSCPDFHIRLSTMNLALSQQEYCVFEMNDGEETERKAKELLICKSMRFLVSLIKTQGINLTDLKNKLYWQKFLFSSETNNQRVNRRDLESLIQDTVSETKNINIALHTNTINVEDDDATTYRRIILRNEKMYPVSLLMNVINRCSVKQPLIDGLSGIYNMSKYFDVSRDSDNEVSLEVHDFVYFMLYDHGIIDMLFRELFCCINSLILTFMESLDLSESTYDDKKNIFMSYLSNFKDIFSNFDAVSVFKVASFADFENLYIYFRILNFFIESPISSNKKPADTNKKSKKKKDPNKRGISTTGDSFSFDNTLEDSNPKDGNYNNYDSGSRQSLKSSIKNDIMMRLLGLCYKNSKKSTKNSIPHRNQTLNTLQYYSSPYTRRHATSSSTASFFVAKSNTSYEPRNVYRRALKMKSVLDVGTDKKKQYTPQASRLENLFNIVIINTMILYSFLNGKLMAHIDKQSTTNSIVNKWLKYTDRHFLEFQAVYRLLRELLWMVKKISKDPSLCRSELLRCLNLPVIVELFYNCTSDFENLSDSNYMKTGETESDGLRKIIGIMNKISLHPEGDPKEFCSIIEIDISNNQVPVSHSKIGAILSFKKFTTIIHYMMDIRINTCLVLANLNSPMSPVKTLIQKSLLPDNDKSGKSKTFRDFIIENFKFDAINGGFSDETDGECAILYDDKQKCESFGIFNHWTSGDFNKNRITESCNVTEFVELYLRNFCDLSKIYRYTSRNDDDFDNSDHFKSFKFSNTDNGDKLLIKFPCLISLCDIYYLKISNLIAFQNSLYQTVMFFDPKNFLQDFHIDDFFKILIYDDTNKLVLGYLSENDYSSSNNDNNLRVANMFNCMVLEYKNHILCVLRNLLIHKNSIVRCIEMLQIRKTKINKRKNQLEIEKFLKRAIMENLNVYNLIKCPEVVLTMLAIAVNLITVNGDDSRNMICWDEEPSSQDSVSEPGVLFKRINDIFQLKLPIVDDPQNFGNSKGSEQNSSDDFVSIKDNESEYRELKIFLKNKYKSHNFEEISSVIIKEMISEDCNNLSLEGSDAKNINNYLISCYKDLNNENNMTHYYTNIKIACAWIMLNLLWSNSSEAGVSNTKGSDSKRSSANTTSMHRIRRHNIIQRHALMFTNGVFECAKRYSNSSDINLRERATTVTNLLNVSTNEIKSMIANLRDRKN